MLVAFLSLSHHKTLTDRRKQMKVKIKRPENRPDQLARDKENTMKRVLWLTMAMAAISLSGCVPVAIGATAAVVADQEIEKNKGGDGLF